MNILVRVSSNEYHIVIKCAVLLLVTFLSSIATSSIAMAKDFGMTGNSAQIIEQDLLEYIKQKLSAIGEPALQAHQEKIKDQVVAKVKRPVPVKNISKALQNNIRKFDPSFTVEEDIRDSHGNMIHAEGTKINPLEYHSFDETWIFIDGDDQEQRELATHLVKTVKNAKIILVSGKPGLQPDGSWLYFDQSGEICKKMGISKVPSIIKQIKDELQITIEEVIHDEVVLRSVTSDNTTSGDVTSN